MRISSYLNKIRTTDNTMGKNQTIIYSIMILIAGILLGVFSKWLDSMAINDAIAWQFIFGFLDLRNIFSEIPVWVLFAVIIAVFSKTPKMAAEHVLLFFVGMTISYHLYTVYVCGFNPKAYMMIWYTITLLSPIPAVFCWYAKGDGKIASLLRVLIFSFMMYFTFNVGADYFDLGRKINLLFLTAAIAVLWKGWKNTLISTLFAFVLCVLIQMIY